MLAYKPLQAVKHEKLALREFFVKGLRGLCGAVEFGALSLAQHTRLVSSGPVSAPWRAAGTPDVRETKATISYQVICDAQRVPRPVFDAPNQPAQDRIARAWQHFHDFPGLYPRRAAHAGVQPARRDQAPLGRKLSGFSLTIWVFIIAPVPGVTRRGPCPAAGCLRWSLLAGSGKSGAG